MDTPYTTLDESLDARLLVRSRQMQLSPEELAQRYVNEGLLRDEHPLIELISGPGGRRARLRGTLNDVWEVIAVIQGNDDDSARASRLLQLPLGFVHAARDYYQSHRQETDELIELNRHEAITKAAATENDGSASVHPER